MPNRSLSSREHRRDRSREPRLIVAATLVPPQPVALPKPVVRREERARRWTRDEDLFLRKHYPTQGAIYCAERLGRTKPAVNRRAENLRITFKMKQRWTRKEEAMLRTLYRRHTALDLARMMKRSEQSVRAKLHLMGLTEPTSRPWSTDEIAYLRKHYGSVRVVEMAEELGRTPDAVELKAGRLGLARNNKRLNPEEIARVVAQLGRVPYTQLAVEFGVDPHTIRRIAERNGYRDRPTSRPWTAEDDEQLRQIYGTMKRDEVATALGRTMVAVACRAKEMGLTNPRPRLLPLRNWTEEEDTILRVHYGTKTHPQLAELVGRTPSAVGSRLSQLGMKGRRGPKGK